MSAPPYDITDFRIVEHGVLRLTFADGLEGEVDLRGRLSGPVFARVRTPEGFREAFVEDGVIRWPGDVDFAPDTLYERVRSGVWPSCDSAARGRGRSAAAERPIRSARQSLDPRQARRGSGAQGARSNWLGRLAGGWSEDEFHDFERATARFEAVDEELWR